MIRWGLAISLPTLLVLLLYTSSSGSGVALAKCNPNRTPNPPNSTAHFFDGILKNNGQRPYKVEATILNYSPWVYPGKFSTAWSMLDLGTNYWAQVGWIEYAYDVRYSFAQYKTVGADPITYLDPHPNP